MDYFQGTINEIVQDRKISYTWHEPNIPDFPRTVVTWELEKLEDNRTRVIYYISDSSKTRRQGSTTKDGRISVAGITTGNVKRLAECIYKVTG